MRRGDIFQAAVDAADEILERYYAVQISKALNPLNPKDFLVIMKRLTAALKGLTGVAEAMALKKAIGMLDVDWKSTSDEQKDKVVEAAKAALTMPAAIWPSINQKLLVEAEHLAYATKGANKKEFGLNIQTDLSAVDKRILQHVAYSQSNFVRDQYGVRSVFFGHKAKQIVTESLAKGYGREEIKDELKNTLGSAMKGKSDNYWRVVGSTFAARARAYASLSSFAEGGTTTFTFEAVMDGDTTEVCRFMHGRKFSVQRALEKYQEVEQADDPEDVKFIQPWVQEGKDSDGNKILYMKGKDGSRTTVAQVDKPGFGKPDAAGSYSKTMSSDALMARGVSTPPLHGNCRSTIIPDELVTVAGPRLPPPASWGLTPYEPPKEPAPSPPPPAAAPEPDPQVQPSLAFGTGGVKPKPLRLIPALSGPPVPVYAPPPPDKQSIALTELAAMADKGKLTNPMKVKALPANVAAAKLFDGFQYEQFVKHGQKPIDTVKSTMKELDAAKIEHLIKNPKLLKGAEILAAKVGKDIIVLTGDEVVAAAKLMGQATVKPYLLDAAAYQKFLDQKAKEAAAAAAKTPAKVPAPPAPAPKPQPPATAAAPKPAPLPAPPPPKTANPAKLATAENILHEKTGAQAGSNEGGFYTGKDGVKRYVKFYKDSGQADGEVLAASIYKNLGMVSPNVTAFQHDGKNVFASEILEGTTLDKGLTKTSARAFLKGFVGDILTGNWDSAGMSGDNALLTKNGDVVRIDNGGSFLMRAKAGRKDPALLGTITEWDRFFQPSNPGYYKIVKAAGYSSPEDFKDDVKKQINDVLNLRKKWGSWDAYVSSTGAFAGTPADRKAVVDMLEARTKLLEAKLKEFDQPKVQSTGWRAPPITGVAPNAKLTIEALPETAPFPTSKDLPSRMPSGEKPSDYAVRTREHVKNIPPESRKAIKAFTGNAYGDIRAAEHQLAEGKKPSSEAMRQSNAITEAYKTAKAEPMTTYRGNANLPKSVVEGWIRNTGKFRFGMNNTGATSSSAWHAGVSVERFMHGTSDPTTSVKVLFQVHQKSGIPIGSISTFGESETEVLLSRDAEFKVLSVARWKGKKNIVVIEVEEI